MGGEARPGCRPDHNGADDGEYMPPRVGGHSDGAEPEREMITRDCSGQRESRSHQGSRERRSDGGEDELAEHEGGRARDHRDRADWTRTGTVGEETRRDAGKDG